MEDISYRETQNSEIILLDTPPPKKKKKTILG